MTLAIGGHLHRMLFPSADTSSGGILPYFSLFNPPPRDTYRSVEQRSSQQPFLGIGDLGNIEFGGRGRERESYKIRPANKADQTPHNVKQLVQIKFVCDHQTVKKKKTLNIVDVLELTS